MKDIYNQLKQLKLTHIFYGHITAALIVGAALIVLLLWQSLPYFIPVVLWMMYYMPLVRMNMRRYLYSFRGKFNNLPDEQLFDSITFIHTEWKMTFSKPVWMLRINFLVFVLFAGSLWLIRLVFIDSTPYSNVLIHVTASIQACLLVWLNIRQYLWLKEEIPQCNEELF